MRSRPDRLIAALVLMACCAACESSTDAGAPEIAVAAGNDQVAGAGAMLPDSVRVSVTRGGRPMANVEVTWHVLQGGGAVAQRMSRTDAAGVATASWRLGLDEGPQVLLAASRFGSTTIRATARFSVASVAAGYRHTCALTTPGVVYCWGWNAYGQLGSGDNPSVSAIRRIDKLRFAKITAGWTHNCGLTSAGEIFCWGDNSSSQLGTGGAIRSFAPAAIASDQSFIDVSAGFLHSCAATRHGEIYCWGSGGFAQIGASKEAKLPAKVATSTSFISVAAGESHTCALSVVGHAYCWGYNRSGEVGNAQFGASIATPIQVTGDVLFSSIAAGVQHTCGIQRSDGAAYCWGRNFAGEIGTPALNHATTPSRVGGTSHFEQIATGDLLTCAVASGLYCWGADIDGNTFVPRLKLSSASSVSVGFAHACAVVDGEVWCWGSNQFGQLGVTGIPASATPIRVPLGLP